MTKFKVGDKVRILEASKIVDAIELGFKTGEIYDVVEIDVYNVLFISNGKSWLQIFEEELQYIEKVCKPTKNQRITALEKEIAELRSFKEKIEHLEQAVQQYFAVPGEPSTVEDKPKLKGITIELEKTPNQQRKEIIEKAKEFVEFLVPYISGDYDKETKYGNIDNSVSILIYNVEFEVNEQKRIVVALLRGKLSKVVYHRGIAKCHPSDVLNEHIGKAIALGRALGLDVSKFEQAVQPNDIIEGMEIMFFNFIGNEHKSGVVTKYDEKNDDVFLTDEKLYSPLASKSGFCHKAKKDGFKILNDTNAIYGGVEL